MTLFRQLLVFMLILITLLFAGTWLALIDGTRTFLSEQLASNSQDTATSLGLSITPHVADGDMATVETMINAVFDRGYYTSIELSDISGRLLIDRSMDIVIDGVPEWFIELVPLETGPASSIVMSGWTQAGQLSVESNPGYAYKEFWNIAIMMTTWFALMVLLAALLGGIGIRHLLKPLHRLEEQAEALTKRQYILQEKLPKTRELNSVVRAMNNMTLKVKSMFEGQAAVAERLRKRTYLDELTGLGNRRYFEGQIKPRLERRDGNIKGALLLVQVNDLKKLNEEKGYLAGDTLLQRVAEILKESTQAYGKSVVAHLTGGDFAIFLPDVTLDDAEHTVEKIISNFPQLAIEGLTLSDNIGHTGGVLFARSYSLGELLSEADSNLRSAQREGANRWRVTRLEGQDEETPQEQQKWKAVLQEVLDKQEIGLVAQSVINAANPENVLHRELFSRVTHSGGQVTSAGVFVPLAERLGVISSLDKLVIEKALKISSAQAGCDKISINMSTTSLHEESFMSWLNATLLAKGQTLPRLVFEFIEFSAVQNLEPLKDFRDMIEKYGHGIGLDHFGSSFSNFGYLHSLRPDYVKLDRGYTSELGEHGSDSEFFVTSLCSVAHSLDIQVIVEGVEKQAQFDLLNELGVDGMQGYLIDRPEPLVKE